MLCIWHFYVFKHKKYFDKSENWRIRGNTTKLLGLLTIGRDMLLIIWNITVLTLWAPDKCPSNMWHGGVKLIFLSHMSPFFRSPQIQKCSQRGQLSFYPSGGIIFICFLRSGPKQTVNNLMVRLQSRNFGECQLPLHFYYSQVHYKSEW